MNDRGAIGDQEPPFAKEIAKQLGKRLRDHRKRNGWTLQQIAEAIAVTHPTVQRWEAGERSPPLYAIIYFARLYDVSVDDLLGFKQKKPKQKLPTLVELLGG